MLPTNRNDAVISNPYAAAWAFISTATFCGHSWQSPRPAISRAPASQVNRTQSAVSMQIKRLEEMVGAALFERGPRGVLAHAQGQRADRQCAPHRVASRRDGGFAEAPPLDGPVRIGIPEEYSHAILSRALAPFRGGIPQVEITVKYAHSASQMASLECRRTRPRGGLRMAGFSDGEVLMRDPTVWVTSTLHSAHEETPLPVALYSRVPAGARISPSSRWSSAALPTASPIPATPPAA